MKKLNITALSVMLALGLTACQPPEAEKSAPAASGASGASGANAGGTKLIDEGEQPPPTSP